jgi:hypothetical protein
MRDLNNRKTRNILKLKVDEMIADAVKRIILLKALNFFSPRFFSFTNLVIGKRSTNPFFRLLNSPDRSVEMSQGSS